MNLIKYGEKFFDEVEIATYRMKSSSVKVSLNQVSMSSSSHRVVTVIRGVKGKRMGIFIVDSEDEGKIKMGIEKAARNASNNTPDENWVSFPEPGSYERGRALEIEYREPDFYVSLMNEAVKDVVEGDENAVVADGSAGNEFSINTIMNSHGVEITQEIGASYMYLYAVGRVGERVTPGLIEYDVKISGELDKEFVTSSLLKKLKNAYRVVKSDSTEGMVVVEPMALGMLLYFTLIPAVSGERKVKGTSPIAERVGDRVLSEKISVYDDPWHEESVNPVIADDEGVPARKIEIFRDGVFKNFLWNSYWGNVEGVGSTGNGRRVLSTGGIGISPNNIVIGGGRKSVEDILSDMDEGYYITRFQGAHSSNPDTGDFSVVANPAFKIENGEIVGSTVFMMSGNIYDLLNQVEEVSREQRKTMMMGSGVMPYILFRDVKMAPVSR